MEQWTSQQTRPAVGIAHPTASRFSGTVIWYFASSFPPRTSIRFPLPRSMPSRSRRSSHGWPWRSANHRNRRFTLTLRAFPEKTARALRAETDQTFHQHVDLVERLPAGKLVQQLQHRPFRRRQHDRPVPVAEVPPGQAAVNLRLVRRPVDGHCRLEPFETGRDWLGAKQLAGIVKDEGRGDG